MTSTLLEDIKAAEVARTELLARLAQENTDCWRLFHGVAEGRPGLTIDRYGALVLAQTFRDPLEESEVVTLAERFGERFVYNHRGNRAEMFSYHQPSRVALQPVLAREFGLSYQILARHRGLDPHLFLDLRMGRRWVLNNAAERSVLNLFAYSCGLGQVASRGGASEVWNVDFSDSALEVGRHNLARNGLSTATVRFIQEDYFAAIWQLSGLGVRGKRRRKKHRRFEARPFDLVLLDPPARARGAFHTVDLINDYQSVFKPAWLATAPGGTLLATNNVGSVSPEDFEELILACARKAGRPIGTLQWLTPDDDFPSFDRRSPLKVVLCS
jgi:23S rRNA (cytosine1962-C5)-methyltransferase